MQQPSNTLRLALLGIGAALIYAAALARFPLLAIYSHPIQNLDKLTGSAGLTGAVMAASVVLLFVAYALGALALAAPAGDRAQGRLFVLIAGAPLLFAALLLLVYPTTSVDLYDYLFRGRMLVRYGANTFVSIPRDFQFDPLFWYVAWRRSVTAYGPIWEGMSRITAHLAGEAPGPAGVTKAAQDAELLRLLLAYKGLSALGFLLCGAAIWGVLAGATPKQRLLGLYLWLWNPLALWESLAAGHNDSWMALLIVLAIWVFGSHRQGINAATRQARIRRGRRPGSSSSSPLVSRSVAAFLALTLGGLIKYLALFLSPVLLSAAIRRLPTRAQRLRLLILGGLSCMTLAVLAYAPLWAGWATFQNFSDRGTLFTASWLAVLQLSLAWVVSKELSQAIAASLGVGLLVFGIIWASAQAWRAPRDLPAHLLWLLLWFLFLANPWFQPWYLLWALALVALQPWRAHMVWTVSVFCCTALLSYIAGSFLRPVLGWHPESSDWNALISTVIYGPPLIALIWRRRYAAPIARILRLPSARIPQKQLNP